MHNQSQGFSWLWICCERSYMSDIESTKIEKRALYVLQGPIVDSDYLDDSFQSMDKELSWDGYIYSYKDKMFLQKHLMIKYLFKLKGITIRIKKRLIEKGYNFQ